MPKLTNPDKRQMRGMLDRRSSAFVRSYGKCEMQGCDRKDLTNSHIVGRTELKVQFDPRNIQCLCAHHHGIFTHNPIMFARWIETTTCGKYVDTIQVQLNNRMAKFDYDLWFKVYKIITERHYNLEDARQWLGQELLWSELDILRLV